MTERKSRTEMPKRDPAQRARDFDEVALGYTEEQAREEAARCLMCKKKPCVAGCPVGVDIPGFIELIKAGNIAGAIRLIKQYNALPAICGRVCPQESQCEKVCSLAKKGAVAIGALERFAADWEAEQEADVGGGVREPCQAGFTKPAPKTAAAGDGTPALHSFAKASESKQPRVALVGSGPASLTAAGELAQMGYGVTVFESLHATGGVLRYGIPAFRLPRKVLDREVDYIRNMGVEIQTNVVIGKTLTLQDLFAEGYAAIFIGAGAGLPYFLDIPGENHSGVYTANEFLTRVNLMQAHLFPEYDTPISVGERVAVIGGGNVAMDSARGALRLGAKSVTIVYRRSRVEQPARAEEIENAEEEGIKFRFLSAPKSILADGQGRVNAIDCQEMELGEPDKSGRARPRPKPGAEFTLPIDTVIVAIGAAPNPLLTRAAPDFKIDRHGRFEVNRATMQTTLAGVFAGGDIANDEGTVIAAMGDGKRAAQAIDEYLKRKQ